MNTSVHVFVLVLIITNECYNVHPSMYMYSVSSAHTCIVSHQHMYTCTLYVHYMYMYTCKLYLHFVFPRIYMYMVFFFFLKSITNVNIINDKSQHTCGCLAMYVPVANTKVPFYGLLFFSSFMVFFNLLHKIQYKLVKYNMYYCIRILEKIRIKNLKGL